MSSSLGCGRSRKTAAETWLLGISVRTFLNWTEEKKNPLMLTWVGTTQSVEGLRRTKRSKGRVKLFSLWNVQLLLLSDIKASSSPIFGLGDLILLSCYPLVFKSLDLERTDIFDFPGSPACRWHVMGLHILHKCMSHLL